MSGHIDVIHSNGIEGWAYDPTKPDTPIYVEFCVKGKVIATCLADIYRNDLKEAGVGNGFHGFRMALPVNILENNIIDVREAESLRILDGSPANLQIVHSLDNPLDIKPNIVIDVTSLIWHMNRYDNFMGISRVEAEIIEAIFNFALYDLGKITLVNLSYEKYSFEKIEVSSFFKFLTMYKSRDNSIRIEREDGLRGIERYLTFENFDDSDDQIKNTIWIALGSSVWAYEFYFNLLAPLFSLGMKFVTLAHDMIPLAHPEICPPEMNDIFNYYIRKILRFSSHILSVSNSCKKDILKISNSLGYECPPVTVINNGGNTFRQLDSKDHENKNFVLVVSTIERRKNHIILLRAWDYLIKKYPNDIPDLIFVGSIGKQIKYVLDFLKGSNFLNGHVKIITNASDQDLAILYKNCLFTAYPSLYEGWGLPVTESLSFGKTCLCSNASSLPEAGGQYCVYFDPKDIEECQSLLEKLIFDAEYRKTLEAKITDNYIPLTWKKVAERVVTISRRIGPDFKLVNHKALPAGEYVFWSPPKIANDGLVDLSPVFKFGRGILSRQRLTWDNYALADEIVIAGKWHAHEEKGILAEDGFFNLQFKPLLQDNQNPEYVYIAIEPYDNRKYIINVKHGIINFDQIEFNDICVLALAYDRFISGDIINIILCEECSSQFYLKSVYFHAADELGSMSGLRIYYIG